MDEVVLGFKNKIMKPEWNQSNLIELNPEFDQNRPNQSACVLHVCCYVKCVLMLDKIFF